MPRREKTDNDKTFGWSDFLVRLVGALLLVLITYNPSGHSYVHWVMEAFRGEGLAALHYFSGAVLLAGWSILVISTERSLGGFGTFIGALLIGTGIWLLIDMGWIQADSREAVTWLALIALGLLLAIGLSWSHVWRRLSGQYEVDVD